MADGTADRAGALPNFLGGGQGRGGVNRFVQPPEGVTFTVRVGFLRMEFGQPALDRARALKPGDQAKLVQFGRGKLLPRSGLVAWIN